MKKIIFTDYFSKIRFLDGSKLARNRKNDNDIKNCRHDVIVNFFWHCFNFPVKFIYWSKSPQYHHWFSSYEIVFIRDWQKIRLSEITPSEFCRISRDWDELWIPKATNVSNGLLLNLAKFEVYNFYRFWVIKGKRTTNRGVRLPHQIRVK